MEGRLDSWCWRHEGTASTCVQRGGLGFIKSAGHSLRSLRSSVSGWLRMRSTNSLSSPVRPTGGSRPATTASSPNSLWYAWYLVGSASGCVWWGGGESSERGGSTSVGEGGGVASRVTAMEMCVCVCVRAYLCLCVCVSVRMCVRLCVVQGAKPACVCHTHTPSPTQAHSEQKCTPNTNASKGRGEQGVQQFGGGDNPIAALCGLVQCGLCPPQAIAHKPCRQQPHHHTQDHQHMLAPHAIRTAHTLTRSLTKAGHVHTTMVHRNP
jgi:hypothetical protein